MVKGRRINRDKLIRANHQLTLGGTPIENHLGELWNLFEFLSGCSAMPAVRSRAARAEP